MRLVRHGQTRWFFHKSVKPTRPTRLMHLRPNAGRSLVFRPSRMGLQLNRYEFETYRVQVRQDHNPRVAEAD